MSQEQKLYIASSGEAIKIGRSVDPQTRVRDLSVGNPEDIELLHEWESENPVQMEKALHKHCEQWNKSGEWFSNEAYYYIAGFISGIGNELGKLNSELSV